MLLKLYLNGLKYRNHLIQKLKRPRIEYLLALQNYPSTVIYRIQFQIILEQHEIQKAPNPKSGRHLNWISLGITQIPKYSYIQKALKKLLYLGLDFAKGARTLVEELSFVSNELSSDNKASNFQLGSGSIAIPSILWGQRGSNFITPLIVYTHTHNNNK